MGLGDFPLGDFPAGDDPSPAAVLQRTVPSTAAVYFDPSIKDFPLGADGFYQEIDPVDQRVALALTTVEKTIAGTPTVGSRLRKIKYLDPTKIKAAVTDAVRVALAQELRAKTISLVGIDIEMPNASALLVRVTYRNLMLAQTTSEVATATLKVTLNG
jgi:hypothetical protein